ncbi:MAG: DUF2946 family protein [Alphaproteobacteria bacterium]|nr:DUF2946 family protein [Alphaproteobacteria bacterium]
MLMRALIPAGWMPGPAGTGGHSSLIICTGQGLTAITINPDGTPAKQAPDGHHRSQHDHDVCPFAAAAHLAPPAFDTALTGLPSAVVGVSALAKDGILRAAVLARSHPPRAPPNLA